MPSFGGGSQQGLIPSGSLTRVNHATTATAGLSAHCPSAGWLVCVGNQGVKGASPENTHTNAEVTKFPQGISMFSFTASLVSLELI